MLSKQKGKSIRMILVGGLAGLETPSKRIHNFSQLTDHVSSLKLLPSLLVGLRRVQVASKMSTRHFRRRKIT